jgi:MFS family permease
LAVISPGLRVAWIVALLHVLAFADRLLLAPLAPLMAKTLRLDDASLGLAIGPAMIVPYVGVAFLLGGKIAPELAAGWVRWALAGCAAAVLLGALAPNAPALILSRGLLGIAEASFDISALVLLGSAAAGDRARGLALFTGSALIGKTLALSGSGLLLFALQALRPELGVLGPSWRLVMATFAVLGAAAALMPLSASDLDNTLPAGTPASDGGRRGASRLNYLSLMVPAAAGAFASQGFAAFAPLAMVRRFALTPAYAGALLGLVLLVAGLVGSQVGGEIALRTRRPGGVVLAAPLACALLAALGVWSAGGAAIAFGAIGLMMLSLSILAPLGLEQLQRVTSHQNRGRVMGGYVSFVALLGFGGAPPAIGALSQRLHGPGATMSAICIVVTLATALGGVCAIVLPRPKPSPA